HRRELGVKAHQQQGIDATIPDLFDLAARIVETRQRCRAGKEFAWNRLEADRNRLHTQRIGTLAHAPEQGAMAAMHAIESTNADHTALRRQTGTEAIAKEPEHRRSITAGCALRGEKSGLTASRLKPLPATKQQRKHHPGNPRR